MKNNIWFNWIFSIVICILYISKFQQLNTNLVTIFDEGFYYLSIWKIKHGLINEGLSLWTFMVNATCSEKITSNILNLRYLRFFFQIATIAVYLIISLLYLIKKGILDTLSKNILYILLVFWLSYFILGSIIISYNELQSSFLYLMIGFFLLSTVYEKNKSFFFYFIIGFFSFLSIVTIPPSGVLVSISILIMLWVQYWNQKKIFIQLTFFYLLGFIISVLIIQLFILDLNVAFHNMFTSVNKIINLNRGYDPISLIINLLFYFRDFFIITCSLLGITILYFILSKFMKNWIASLFFLFSLLVLIIYQKKPMMSLSTIWAFPFILFVLYKIHNKSILIIKSLFTFDLLVKVFLFLFPLMASIGTNTDLSVKMIWFILPWSILFAELFNGITLDKENTKLKMIFIVCLLVMIFQPIKAFISDFNNDTTNYYFNEYKPISGIKLSKPQFDYFNRINLIFKKYNFKENKDVIFSTTFDHMTICAFNAIPSETFQVPNDFIAEKDKKNIIKPDFIFLDKYDYDMMSDSIKLLDWGFPENYDKYYVGTPDPVSIWDNKRWLYCLKDRKNRL